MLSPESFDLLVCFIFSYAFFYTCNKLVIHRVPRPINYINSVKSVDEKDYRIKRWKNIMVSFIHAVFTSILALYILIGYKELLDDMINVQIRIAYRVNCFVFTYFFYDTVDNLSNNVTRKTYEMMIHHFVVLTAYAIILIYRKYVGCVSVILLLEVNSVFLHLRHILIHYGVDRKSYLFQFNSIMNVLTLFVFRVCVLTWMANWIYHNHHLLVEPVRTLSSLGCLIFLIMNVILLIRVILSDYVRKGKKNNINIDSSVSADGQLLTNGVSSNYEEKNE